MQLRADALPFYPKTEKKTSRLRPEAPEFNSKVDRINYSHTIINGMREGFSIGFSDDGIKVFEGEYKNDKRHGPCRWYFPNGKINMVAYYQNDKKNGLCVTYYKNEKLKSVGIYKDNEKTSIWFYWDEHGVLISTNKY
jgi:antitoxin component YwqK of YwqJK toxin-antitoxin module